MTAHVKTDSLGLKRTERTRKVWREIYAGLLMTEVLIAHAMTFPKPTIRLVDDLLNSLILFGSKGGFACRLSIECSDVNIIVFLMSRHIYSSKCIIYPL